jgi:hypothetical protein
MNERRKNCQVFHEKIQQCFENVKAHGEWINGNGKPGAKERLGSMAVQINILLALNSVILAAIVALFFRGMK